VLAAVVVGAAPAAGDARPPAPRDPYVLAGYVPAGFSGFGTWTARKDATLYAAPGSRKVVATIARCDEVTAQDGVIRGHPWAIRALKAHPPFRRGDRMWILARDLEEGYFQLWYEGRVRDDVAAALGGAPPFTDDDCAKPSPQCWLWIDREPRQEHWVKLRTRTGTLGWSDRAGDFGQGPATSNQCP